MGIDKDQVPAKAALTMAEFTGCHPQVPDPRVFFRQPLSGQGRERIMKRRGEPMPGTGGFGGGANQWLKK